MLEPKDDPAWIRYFCGDPKNPEDLRNNELKRVKLYKQVAALGRAFLDLAGDMTQAGYSAAEAEQIKREVDTYVRASDVVKFASKPLAEFRELGLLELLMSKGIDGAADIEKAVGGKKGAAAEAIENNIRKKIIEEQAVNPKYYEKMSELLEALIEQRRADVLDYQEYLQQIIDLAGKVSPGGSTSNYPQSINSNALKALYDNLGNDELLAVRVDTAVRYTKEAYWVGDRLKERKVKRALRKELPEASDDDIEQLLSLIKHQADYQ